VPFPPAWKSVSYSIKSTHIHLFYDKCRRIAFVQEPELAGGRGRVARVQEDAAVGQRAVEIRDK